MPHQQKFPWYNETDHSSAKNEQKGNPPTPLSLIPQGELHPILSCGHYYAIQQMLAQNTFESVEGSPFPRASVNKGGVKGFAELRPITPDEALLIPPEHIDALAKSMWEQREELSDKDADVLDALSMIWLHQARHPEARVPVYMDDILRMRGIKPKKDGHGDRGGFHPEQRLQILFSFFHIQNIWIEVTGTTLYEPQPGRRKSKPREERLQSRAFIITDRIGQKRLRDNIEIIDARIVFVTPGSVFGRYIFGPGRQLAMLSANALRYDPYRQKPEKRLLRYLSWQWRIAAKQSEFLRSYRVATLLDEIGLKLRKHNPLQTRERLEHCLDTLQGNGDIAAWQYKDLREEALPTRGWTSQWMNSLVLVEAPETIKDHYRRLTELIPKPLPSIDVAEPWGARLREKRKNLGLTQMKVAEQLGISQPYVGQIERGRRPSKSVARKIRRWLKDK